MSACLDLGSARLFDANHPRVGHEVHSTSVKARGEGSKFRANLLVIFRLDDLIERIYEALMYFQSGYASKRMQVSVNPAGEIGESIIRLCRIHISDTYITT